VKGGGKRDVKCMNCGSEEPAGSVYCGTCGNLISGPPPARTGDESLSIQQSGSMSASVIAGTPIHLGDGESVWREYAVTRLRWLAQGKGTLIVTDSRVILFAYARGRTTARRSSLIQETKIAGITGAGAYVSRKIHPLALAVTTLLALGGLFEIARGSTGLGILLLVLTGIAVLMLLLGFFREERVGISIIAGAHSIPVNVGRNEIYRTGAGFGLRNFIATLGGILGAPTAQDVLSGVPDRDADLVVAELGALILDLQSKGALAAERWKRPQT
jgi:hypothetical protein